MFSTQVEVKRGRLTPEGEALWVGHRLVQLFELCAEPGLVQCHSPEIQSFWTKIVQELFEKPRTVDTIG